MEVNLLLQSHDLTAKEVHGFRETCTWRDMHFERYRPEGVRTKTEGCTQKGNYQGFFTWGYAGRPGRSQGRYQSRREGDTTREDLSVGQKPPGGHAPEKGTHTSGVPKR